MSDLNFPNENDTDPTTPAPKRKRRRRWPWVILVLLLLLVGVVLLAPAIISTTPVKNLVVSQVNKNLNGRVEIASWDIGWTSGVKVDGVRVFDAANAQIAEMKSFRTQLSLIDAAKGKIHLGETVVENPNFNLKMREDGSSNFGDLVKQDASQPEQTTVEKDTTAKPAEGGDAIDISGDLKLVNLTGTVEQPGKPTLHITGMNAGAKIVSLNDPIDHSVDIALRVADKPAGKIQLKGTASAKDGNVNNLNVNDTLTLADIDMASLRPLIPADAGVDTESGVTSGTMSLVIADGKSLTINGDITGKQYAIGGPALKGDKFVTSNLKISLPIVVSMPNGPNDAAAMTIKTGGAQPAPIAITWDQGSISVAADAPVSALQNMAANKPPGSAGKVDIDADINVAALAKMLPNTLSIPPEVKLDSGKLTEAIDLAIQPDAANFSVVTDIKDVAGTRAGKPVRIQPINVTLKGNARGSSQALPDVRDLSLSLTSSFATANFNAPTLSQLKGQAKADLRKAVDELGQVIDLEGKQATGQVLVNIDTAKPGDVQDFSKPTTARLDATVTGVTITGVGEKPINVERFAAAVDSTLNTTAEGALQSIDKTKITLQNFKGPEATVDVLVDNVAVTMGETMNASANVAKLILNMEKLQDDLRPFVKALQDAGRLDLGVIDVKLAAKVTQTKDTTTANITGLSVTESKGLFALSQPSGGTLNATLGKDSMQAAGKLGLKADLKRASALAKQFQKEVVAAGAKQPTINAGTLEGTIDLATVDAKNLTVAADLATKGLSIDPGNGQNVTENVTLALRSTAAQDFSAIKDTNFALTGSFGDVKVENVAVDLPKPAVEGGPAPMPIVKSAKLGVNITDMGRIDSLMTALSPPPPVSTDPKVPATQPTRVTAGSIKVAADVKQEGQTLLVNMTELAANGLRLQQGQGTYELKPITGKLAAKVQLNEGAAEPVKQVAVTEMDIKAGFADVSMPKPIVIDAPMSDAPKPTGSIKVAGKLQNLTEIPEALASKKKGELYPYEGDFVLTQDIAMNGNVITPKGLIDITNFVVYKDGQPFVREPKVTIANDLGADLTAKKLTITQLLIDMPQSGALKVAVTGGVTDWESRRQLDNILVKLGGDWEKLWTIVKPMVPADSQEMVKDLTLTGKLDREIRVSGSMPANVEGPAATKNLQVVGSFGIEKITWPSYGITEMTGLDVPFRLQDNFLRTTVVDETKYKPVKVNGGEMELRDMEIDLSDSVAPRLNTPKTYGLFRNVSLTAALTDKLGQLFKNPLFAGSKESHGRLTLTIDECRRLPLSDIMTKAVPENDGYLHVTYSIVDFKTLNELTTLIAYAIDDTEKGDKGSDLQGGISNAVVEIRNGEVVQDTTLVFGQRQTPLRLVGGVDMSTTALKDFKLNLPPGMLKEIDKNLTKYLPSGFDFAMRGTVSKPQIDFMGSVRPMLIEAGKKAFADEAGKAIFGKGKEPPPAQADPNKPADQQQPPPKKPEDDPIGTLQDIFGKKKKK